MSDERVRIDKWLWAARFFKTRAAAQQAIEGGHVKLSGERVKPAREVRLGDELTVQIGMSSYVIRVTGLSDRRGPAVVARTLYEESEASRLAREGAAAVRRFTTEPAADRTGRPTKQERRRLDRWRGF